MKNQYILRKHLSEIFPTVCTDWQKEITNLVLFQSGDKIEVSEDLILRAFNAADKDQKKFIEKHFKINIKKSICEEVNNEKSLALYLNLNIEDLFVFNQNTKNEEERYLNACKILPKIAKVYNEGTILNWNNVNEEKWFCYKDFYAGRGGAVGFHFWCYRRNCPAEFYYKNENLNRKAYDNFKIYFEDYFNYHA